MAIGVLLLLLSVGTRPTPRDGEAPSRAVWPSAAARGRAASVVTLRAPGPLMRRIPGGSFLMGSTALDVIDALQRCAREPLGEFCNEQDYSDELAQHWVMLPSFYLDRTEVTVGAYARCVAAGICAEVTWSAGALRFSAPDLPMSLVTWEDARRYCAFRGARLPTEAEWERAARGTRARRYPWGELWNGRVANHGRYAHAPGDLEHEFLSHDARDGHAELAPVGSHPSGATPEGVLDLAGNVSEWVEDWYEPGYRAASPGVPPPPSATSSERVVRGGDYATGAAWLRGAARASADPGTRSPRLGFRCARDARPASTP